MSRSILHPARTHARGGGRGNAGNRHGAPLFSCPQWGDGTPPGAHELRVINCSARLFDAESPIDAGYRRSGRKARLRPATPLNPPDRWTRASSLRYSRRFHGDRCSRAGRGYIFHSPARRRSCPWCSSALRPINLIGVTGRRGTEAWCVRRRWKQSRVVSEYHYSTGKTARHCLSMTFASPPPAIRTL